MTIFCPFEFQLMLKFHCYESNLSSILDCQSQKATLLIKKTFENVFSLYFVSAFDLSSTAESDSKNVLILDIMPVNCVGSLNSMVTLEMKLNSLCGQIIVTLMLCILTFFCSFYVHSRDLRYVNSQTRCRHMHETLFLADKLVFRISTKMFNSRSFLLQSQNSQ